MLEPANSAFVSLPLAALAPTLLFVSVNTRYFSGRQIFCALAAALFAGLVAAGLLGFLPALLGYFSVDYGEGASALARSLALAGLLYVFGQQLFTDLLKTRKRLLAALLILVVVQISGEFLANVAILTWGLGLAALAASLELLKNLKAEKNLLLSEAVYEKNRAKHKPVHNFKRKPNIYYLFLESFHSEKAFALLYRQEEDPALRSFLRQRDFQVFDDFLSNKPDTRGTVAALLENKLGVDFRRPPAETPATIRELAGNGYRINFVDSIQYTFLRYAQWADYCSFAIPKWVSGVYSFLGPLFVQSGILRKAVKGIDPFAIDSSVTFKDILDITETRLGKDGGPSFFMIRFGARHRYKQKPAEWEPLYPESYAQAKDNLKEMVALIIRQDPEAVIIAAGDHGGKKHLEIWEGDVNKNIRAAGISHELAALDHFGVFMAVRLPGAVAPLAVHSHINIFPALFSSLSGDPAEKFRDVSVHGCWQVADNGKILPEFKYLSGGMLQVEAAVALRAVNADPGNPDRYVTYANCLLERREFDKAVIFVQAALQRFTGEPRLLRLLAKGYKEQGEYAAAGVVLDKLCKTSREAEAHILRAEVLACQGKPGQAVDLLKSSLPRIKGNRNDLHNYILKLLLQQKRFAEGIDFYLNNCDLHSKSDLLPKFNYARILYAKGDLAGALACWKNLGVDPRKLNSGCADIEVIRPYYFDNLTYQISAMNWEAAQDWAELGLALNTPAPVWYFLLKYYAMEKLGRIEDAVGQLVQKIDDNDNKTTYMEYLGALLLRNRLKGGSLNHYKTAALEMIAHKCALLRKSGLFVQEWYVSNNAEIITRTDPTLSPMLHYVYYGVFENARPNPYFEPHHYIKNNKPLLNCGLEPLLYFSRFGNKLLSDPSPFFSSEAYLAAHPEAFSAQENYLAYYLRSLQGSGAAPATAA